MSCRAQAEQREVMLAAVLTTGARERCALPCVRELSLHTKHGSAGCANAQTLLLKRTGPVGLELVLVSHHRSGDAHAHRCTIVHQ